MPVLSAAQYSELPPNVQGTYNQMMADAANLGKEGFKEFPESRIAEIPEDVRRAHHLAREGLGAEQKLLSEAQEATQRGRVPFHENVRQYMNPYQQFVVNQIAEEGNRNFQENVLPALEARFVKLGRFGGGKHAQMALRAARDLQHEILNRQQQALASGYQQAGQFYNAQQARELEAANQLNSLAAARQGSRLADVATLENQGRYQQQQNQAALDARYQNFLRELEHPMNRLSFQSGIMQGMPYQGINQSYYQTPAGPQATIMNQLGPLAAQIWATRNLMGGGGR